MSLCRGHSHFPRPLFRILFATIQQISLLPRRCAVTYMLQPENASCHSWAFLISRRIEARVPSNGSETVQEYQKFSLIRPLEWGIVKERRKVSAHSHCVSPKHSLSSSAVHSCLIPLEINYGYSHFPLRIKDWFGKQRPLITSQRPLHML